MLIFSEPSFVTKCGFNQARGRIASRVACGINPSKPPSTSDSTIFVIVTSPIFHLRIALPSTLFAVTQKAPHFLVEAVRRFHIDRMAAVQVDDFERGH